MKKITFTFLLLFISLWSWAQLITSTPPFITQDGAAIDIIFDATYGTAGLKDYTGDVYAHAGVITTDSKDGSDWKHASTWGDNATKYKLISQGNNKWKLSITPSMTSYFGLTTGEKVTKLVFVFRSGVTVNGSYLEGKDLGGSDIFVNVFQSGSINVSITNPAGDKAVAVGTVMNIGVATSVSVTSLDLLVNGVTVKTANASSTLNYSYTFATAGDYTLIAKATLNGQTVRDTVLVCAPSAVVDQTRPAGLKDGINYGTDNTSATLIMYAPGKTNVFLIGEFNNWTQLNAYQLKRDGNYWWITLTGLTPGQVYGFQYLVDGVLRVTDAYTEMVLDPWNDKWINQYNAIYPNLKAYPIGKTEGLVSTLQTAKTTYGWEVPNFTMPSKENMVIYELLLRDFTVEKSLNAAILKLDYLNNLGITAIELMPIQEFDGNNSWGYNPNHYFATDKAYGTPEMYKKFIDESHKRGIAVILDIVLNHATGANPFAKLYWNSTTNVPASNNPWMNVTAPHPYGVYNDFNHSQTSTKEFFKRMVQYWITEYKVDGYRLDLTKGFTQTQTTESNASNYDQSRIDNITTYYDAAKSVKSDVMFILEHFCNYDEELALANKGMYLWRKGNEAFSQTAMGYQSSPSSDFGGMNSTPRGWVGFAESHDEERNFYKAKMYGAGNLTTDSIARIKRVPLNIAFTTLIPGPKMIWQFGEMGYDYSIDSNGGRTNEKPSVWGWLNLAHRKAAADASAKIITLRKLYPTAFTQGSFALSIAESDWSAGRRIALTHADLNMVVLGNFQTAAITASPNFQKTGTWYNLLTGAELNVTNTQMTISMQAGELLIFTDRKVNLPSGLKDTQIQSDCTVFPTKTNGKVYISTASAVKNVTVYNMQGMIVKTVSNTYEIDFSNASNGLYIMEVNTLKGKSQYKIIKE
ncbi:MAG: alpha-amylase family glycosyl hydrolase [Paludibacter sp.]